MSNKLVENSKVQYKGLKLRIYPTQEQETLINKTFGCCRLIYNEYLQERNEFYIDNILPIRKTATKTEIANIYKTFKPKTEKEWTYKNCGTHHIRDVNAAVNLKNYIPWEARESTPVESDKITSLAALALQVDTLYEAGSRSQATGGKNVLGFN